MWAAGEYGISLAQPHGAWLSLSYTQADVRPVIGVAAATGVWGVTFLLTFAPAALATLRPRALPAAAAILALAAAASLLAPAPGGRTIRIAVLGGPADAELRPDSPQGQQQLRSYREQIAHAADAGAAVVVLPEKVFDTDERTWPLLVGPLAEPASDRHVTVVAGATARRAGTATNVAVAFPADGGAAVTYTKHHLIPGLESELEAGDAPPVVLPGGLGLIVCKDLDFPGLVRENRNAGAAVLLAPAWDMGSDGWLHGRMAVVRGVETGAAVARAGRNGLLTISTPAGEVLAESDAVRDPDTTIIADVPIGGTRTVYARLGDWFAWLCCAALIVLAIVAARPAAPGRSGRPLPIRARSPYAAGS
nr:hypothetical protein GCM10020063_043500 [Dactylosporangium thailandense]